MKPDERGCSCEEGIDFFNIAVNIAEHQVKSKRYYIFEHPVTSLGWPRMSVDGETVDFDQCMIGLTSPAGTPLQTRTTIKSNIPGLMALFAPFQCDGSHVHVRVQ